MKLRETILVTAMLALPYPIFAQKYEMGAVFTGMHLHKIDEGPLGIGARFDYNLAKWIAGEAEAIAFPSNAAGHYGEKTASFGVRAGYRFGRWGVFAKTRPGIIRFDGGYTGRLDQKTHTTLDAGAVVEYYPSRRTLIRIDISDTIIYYGSANFFNRPNPDRLGTVHNFAPALGFGFRW